MVEMRGRDTLPFPGLRACYSGQVPSQNDWLVTPQLLEPLPAQTSPAAHPASEEQGVLPRLKATHTGAALPQWT